MPKKKRDGKGKECKDCLTEKRVKKKAKAKRAKQKRKAPLTRPYTPSILEQNYLRASAISNAGAYQYEMPNGYRPPPNVMRNTTASQTHPQATGDLTGQQKLIHERITRMGMSWNSFHTRPTHQPSAPASTSSIARANNRANTQLNNPPRRNVVPPPRQPDGIPRASNFGTARSGGAFSTEGQNSILPRDYPHHEPFGLGTDAVSLDAEDRMKDRSYRDLSRDLQEQKTQRDYEPRPTRRQPINQQGQLIPYDRSAVERMRDQIQDFTRATGVPNSTATTLITHRVAQRQRLLDAQSRPQHIPSPERLNQDHRRVQQMRIYRERAERDRNLTRRGDTENLNRYSSPSDETGRASTIRQQAHVQMEVRELGGDVGGRSSSW